MFCHNSMLSFGGELHGPPMPSVLYSPMLLTCFVLSTYISAGNLTTVTSQTMQMLFDSDIFLNYSKYIRPVRHLEDRVDVRASLTLRSIAKLDCVLGVLHTVGNLEVRWTDQLLSWKNYSDIFKDTKTVRMRASDVWVPPVVVANPFDDISGIHTGSDIILINNSGDIIWKPRITIQSLCRTNVQYFPFDVQICNVSFGIVGYSPSEVKLGIMESGKNIDISSLNTNTEWNVDQSNVYGTFSSQSSNVHFEITMSRKPVYFVINLLLPVLLITILITCSFMLPAEEGRGQLVSIGFITLSFYFIHSISFLPKASDRMTYLGYFFMWQMIYSVLVSISAIFSIFLYFRSDNKNIPIFLQKLTSCFVNKTKRKKQIQHIRHITVVPPDKMSVSSTNVVIDPQRSPSCPDSNASEIRYMYPEINRQLSLKSEITKEDSEQIIESQSVVIERQTSCSSVSSNNSNVKRGRKVSPVLLCEDNPIDMCKVKLENDSFKLDESVRKISNASDGGRSSQLNGHWSKPNNGNKLKNEVNGLTNDKQWQTSSIKFRSESQHRNKHVHNSVVIPDITIEKPGLCQIQKAVQPNKKKINSKDQDRKNKPVTWKRVSLILDKIFMLSFLVVNVLVSTFFLFPLAARL